jgi:hypothetical protein
LVLGTTSLEPHQLAGEIHRVRAGVQIGDVITAVR